jgi:hypothetical protein
VCPRATVYCLCTSVCPRVTVYCLCTSMCLRASVYCLCTSVCPRATIYSLCTSVCLRATVYSLCTSVCPRATIYCLCTSVCPRATVYCLCMSVSKRTVAPAAESSVVCVSQNSVWNTNCYPHKTGTDALEESVRHAQGGNQLTVLATCGHWALRLLAQHSQYGDWLGTIPGRDKGHLSSV